MPLWVEHVGYWKYPGLNIRITSKSNYKALGSSLILSIRFFGFFSSGSECG